MSEHHPFAINSDLCVECGQCRRYCPLKGAIIINQDYQHTIVADMCSGCGVCEAFCPVPGALFSKSEEQADDYLKTLKRVIWRGTWHYHDHPVMGPITADARTELQQFE